MTQDPRNFLVRWQTQSLEEDRVRLKESEGTHMDGVRRGDVLWIHVVMDERCFLLGRIIVGNTRIATIDRKARAVAQPGTVRTAKRVDITSVLPRLRFISKTAPRFNKDKSTHWQLFQRRRIEPESADLLAKQLGAPI